MKRNKQRKSFIGLKNCEMTNFLVILELCAFYIEYIKVKFTAIHFAFEPMSKSQISNTGFAIFLAKVSSLPLLKITTKSMHFLPAKMKKTILWIELQTNKVQKVP